MVHYLVVRIWQYLAWGFFALQNLLCSLSLLLQTRDDAAVGLFCRSGHVSCCFVWLKGFHLLSV